ncbi:MAG: hypothetical protein ACQER9_02895 [Nanobdellota archaeon]
MHNSDKILRKMQKKGWINEEIEHAREVFSEHKPHHHVMHPKWDKFLEAGFFITILLLNAGIFYLFMPLIVFNKGFAYLILPLCGLIIGVLYYNMMNNFTHFRKHHHFFSYMIMPLLTLIIFFMIIYSFQNVYEGKINIFNDPLSLGLPYVIMFILPLFLMLFHNKVRKE